MTNFANPNRPHFIIEQDGKRGMPVEPDNVQAVVNRAMDGPAKSVKVFRREHKGADMILVGETRVDPRTRRITFHKVA